MVFAPEVDFETWVVVSFKNLFSPNRFFQATKALRQKDTQDNADNVQRLLICSNRYKCNWFLEQTKCQDLEDEVKRLNGQLDDARKMSELDQETIAQLREVIGKRWRWCKIWVNILPFFPESAWRQKDAALLREQTAQDELTKLKEIVDDQAETIKNLSDTRANLKQYVKLF